MSIATALFMAFTAVLLAVAVCAVHWRRPAICRTEPAPSAQVPPAVQAIPGYAPPEALLLTAQLEVGQAFVVQTKTSRYTFTLRDPVAGLYDAVRSGPKGGRVEEERFLMIFTGTFVPDRGMIFGAFVLGGNMCYRKVRGEEVYVVSPSSPIARVLFSIPDSYQRAS